MSCQVSDEEALGFKTMNVLAALRCRVFPQPETSHRMWNDFMKAVEYVPKLKSTILKCTLLCNWCLGPFDSGTHHSKLVDAAENLLDNCSISFLEEMSEAVSLDRGLPGIEITREEWLAQCTKRIPKVLLCT